MEPGFVRLQFGGSCSSRSLPRRIARPAPPPEESSKGCFFHVPRPEVLLATLVVGRAGPRRLRKTRRRAAGSRLIMGKEEETVWRGRGHQGRAPLARRAGRELEMSPPQTEAVQDQEVSWESGTFEETWLARIRRAFHAAEYETLCKLINVSGSRLSWELPRVLAQEVLMGSLNDFVDLLNAMMEGGVDPLMGPEIWMLVQPWFRLMRPELRHVHAILRTLINAAMIDKAIELVDRMEKGHEVGLPRPDVRSYGYLLLPAAELKGLDTAVSLHYRIMRMGFPSGLFISNFMMVIAAARCDPPDMEATKFWVRKAEEMVRAQGNIFLRTEPAMAWLHTTLMAGYCRLGRISDCFTVMGSMRLKGIVPNAVTLHVLQWVTRDVEHSIEESRQLIVLMQQMGVEPRTANYNLLIRCYALSGQMQPALRVANRMKEQGVPWDRNTYFYLILAVSRSGQTELSLKLLAQMRKEDGICPGSQHYVVTFTGLAKDGFFDDAARVFRRLLESCGGDPFAYNAMIGVHAYRGDAASALELRDAMEAVGLPSTAITYRLLLIAHMKRGEYAQALQLQASAWEAHQRLVSTMNDDSATPQARAEAAASLVKDNSKWEDVFDMLLECAVWEGDETRAVILLEEMLAEGLLPRRRNKETFFSLLPDTLQEKVSTLERSRLVQEAQVPQVELETAVGMSQATSAPSPRALNVVPRSGGSNWAVAGVQINKKRDAIPAHVLASSLCPDWLTGAMPGQASKLGGMTATELVRYFLSGGEPSLECGYRVIHDYHHATVHRRPMIGLRLEPNRALLGRVVPETLESLRELFSMFGPPTSTISPIYVFMNPSAATAEAMLVMLAAATVRPGTVVLLRERPSKEDWAKTLKEDCRRRRQPALGLALTSLLSSLPAAALVNTSVLIARSPGVLKTFPSKFQEELYRALKVDGDDVDSPERPGDQLFQAWAMWLRKQRLRQVIRFDGKRIRLDGLSHAPAVSQANIFRMRALESEQIVTDIFVDEEGAVVELSATPPPRE